MNLSTAIRHTKFNYDTQILAISAVREQGAFRLVNTTYQQTTVQLVHLVNNTILIMFVTLFTPTTNQQVHLPSLTVFNNFPNEKTDLGVVTDFDFSPHSGFLAIAAKTGRVRLYKLNHYRSV